MILDLKLLSKVYPEFRVKMCPRVHWVYNDSVIKIFFSAMLMICFLVSQYLFISVWPALFSCVLKVICPSFLYSLFITIQWSDLWKIMASQGSGSPLVQVREERSLFEIQEREKKGGTKNTDMSNKDNVQYSVEEKKQIIQMIKDHYNNSETDSENKLSIRNCKTKEQMKKSLAVFWKYFWSEVAGTSRTVVKYSKGNQVTAVPEHYVLKWMKWWEKEKYVLCPKEKERYSAYDWLSYMSDMKHQESRPLNCVSGLDFEIWEQVCGKACCVVLGWTCFCWCSCRQVLPCIWSLTNRRWWLLFISAIQLWWKRTSLEVSSKINILIK